MLPHAKQLGVDARPALAGVLQLLEDHDAGALAQDEAVAVLVERPAGRLRIVVALDRARAEMKPPRPIGVMAASEPPVIMTSASSRWMAVQGVADGVGGRGAGRGDGRVGAAQAEVDGDVAGAALAIILGMTNGLILPGPALEVAGVLLFDIR